MPKPMKEDSVQEEEKKKVISPFDYKNYKSEMPKKPGEMTGHDSKKISTGTVYTKKPVKEESHQSATTMKHIPNPSPALKKAAKDIKPGIAGYRDRIAMLKAGGVKEDVEQEVVEGSFFGNDKMAKAAQDSGDSKSIVRMRDAKGTYTATMVRKQGEKDHKEIGRVYDKKDVKEDTEQEEYTFADYLDAARAQYGDEDAVLIANEAFNNKDITLFSDQSQSPEA
jgi:hypothetical protein